MNASDGVLIVALMALVAVLFVLAMTEASLLHLRRSAVAAKAQAGDRTAQHLLDMLDDLTKVMNSILLAVLLAQVLATGIAGVLAGRHSEGSGVTVATVAVTVVLFVYGEAIPKTIAIRRPLHHARRLLPVVRGVRLLMGPAVVVLVWVAELQLPSRGRERERTEVSEDELLHLTGEAAAAGRIELSDAELIERSFALGDLRIGEVLVPRDAMVGVSADAPVSEALSTSIAAGHRRLVVFEGSRHHVVGFVRLRDLADANTDDPDQPVGPLVLEALTVAEGDLVIKVLRAMQAGGRHLAVVRDAAQVTLGMVTIEDIVEELVGAIDEPEGE
ncbi:MAG: CNNM domain-containing protein [Microthrixaceae bacterium]